MTWSVSISNGETSVSESIEAARASAKGQWVRDDASDLRDTLVDQQLALIHSMADTLGEDRPISVTLTGHVEPDGSATLYVSGTFGARRVVTPA